MNKYHHIIWDWNGTLLNDVDVCVALMNDLIQAHPKKIPAIDHYTYQNIFDFPVLQYYERVGFDFHQESFDDLCVKFIGGYRAQAMELKLHPQAKEVLAAIGASDLQQSILSAAKQEGLQQMVLQHQIDHHFEYIFGENDHYAHGKIANGKRLQSQLEERDHHNLLLIGDTVHDFEVAQAIGADCVLVAHGHHSHQKLQQTGVKVVDSLEELVESLDNTFM